MATWKMWKRALREKRLQINASENSQVCWLYSTNWCKRATVAANEVKVICIRGLVNKVNGLITLTGKTKQELTWQPTPQYGSN